MEYDLTDTEAEEWSGVDEPASAFARVVLLKRAAARDKSAAGHAMLFAKGVRVFVARLAKQLGLTKDQLDRAIEAVAGDREQDVAEKSKPGTQPTNKADPAPAAPPPEGGAPDALAAANAKIAELEAKLAAAVQSSPDLAAAARAERIKALQGMLPEAVAGSLEDLSDEDLAALEGALMGKAKAKGAGGPQMSAMAKMVEKLGKDHQATVVELAKLKTAEDVRKVRAEYTDIIAEGQLDGVAAAVHKARATDPEGAKVLEGIIKSQAAAIEASEALTKEIGRGGTGGAGKGAMAKITKAAEEFRIDAAKSGQKLSYAQAVAKVVELNPALAKEYREEQLRG